MRQRPAHIRLRPRTERRIARICRRVAHLQEQIPHRRWRYLPRRDRTRSPRVARRSIQRRRVIHLKHHRLPVAIQRPAGHLYVHPGAVGRNVRRSINPQLPVVVQR